MRTMFQPSIGKKICSLIVLSFVCFFVVIGAQVYQLKSALEDQRRNELTHLGEVALRIVQEEYASSQHGTISAEEAKSRAIARLSALRYGHDDYFWINDLLPRMVMHPIKPELNGQDLSQMQDPNGKRLFVEFVDVVKAKGSGFVDYDWPKPGADKPQPKMSHVVGFTPWNWVIGTGVYIDDLRAQIWSAAERGLAFALILLLLTGTISAFVVRRMSSAVRGMTAAMSRLAAGEIDVPIAVEQRRDEIGEMAKALEVFKHNAVERIRLERAQRDAESQAAGEKQAAERREETERRAAAEREEAISKAAMHKMIEDFNVAVGTIIGTVSTAAAKLEVTAGTLATAADRTQELSTVVAAASEEASANTQSVASATEEMTSSIGEIGRQVQESSKIAGEAVRQAERTNARVNDLSNAAAKIGDVVKLITAVAEQTNLLALNATIEAARAGDAGRGFAVVAQEVKALAAQTAKATDEISSQIAGMQAATQESVTAIAEIGGTIGRISEISATIAAAVDQQGAATREISRNVSQAAQGTAQIATNITDVSGGARETGAASAEVLSSARSLSNDSSRLKIEMDKFLEMVRTERANRRQYDDPNYAGPERRDDRSALKRASSQHASRPPRIT